MVSVLGVPTASLSPQESPADISPPRVGTRAQRGLYRDWALMRFGEHEVQSLVDSGQR